MNKLKFSSKLFSSLLALILTLVLLAGCGTTESTAPKADAPLESTPESTVESTPTTPTETPSVNESAQSGEVVPTPTPDNSKESSPVLPSDTEQSPSSKEPQLPINKENAYEKILAGYNATMGSSAAKLTGVVSYYTAGAGKGNTVSYDLGFAFNKENDLFKATLSYGGSAMDTACYFEGSKKYMQLTDKETGEVTVTDFESSTEYTISNTVMPVLSENLTITSYENAFRRFCDTDFGVELKDGIYTLYFYGSYTELSRICLEDGVYESFLERDVESQFTTSASMEIYLTEDGYYRGMKAEINLESPDSSTKSSISYAFTELNGTVKVEKPDFAKEA